MGALRQMSQIVQMKVEAWQDRIEDPVEALEFAIRRHRELEQQARRDIADVATSQVLVGQQLGRLQERSDTLHRQARQALEHGREDLAREFLTSQSSLESEIAAVKAQHEGLLARQAQLTRVAKQAGANAESFRARIETLKARSRAAEAQLRLQEHFTQLSEGSRGAVDTIGRAEHKIREKEARVVAIDELVKEGALHNFAAPQDDVTAELNRLATQKQVETRLAHLKGGLPAAAAPPALEEWTQPQHNEAPATDDDGGSADTRP
jgi:phage shock protein A